VNDDKNHTNVNFTTKIDMWGINFFFLSLGLGLAFHVPKLIEILAKYVDWVTK
jgi:hypothetical protein